MIYIFSAQLNGLELIDLNKSPFIMLQFLDKSIIQFTMVNIYK